MNRVLFMIALLAIWGLLGWGNISLHNWANNSYQERMDTNYQISVYSGKLLLTQPEYSELKTYLVQPDVSISSLDVYESNDALISYRITAPSDIRIPFVGEPESQRWNYIRGRGGDYLMFVITGGFSFVVGCFLTVLSWALTDEYL